MEKIVGDLTQRANAELDNAKDLFNRGMQELGLENAAEKAAEGLQCVAAAEALVASLASLERFDQMTLEQKLSTISDILMNLAQVLESIAALLLFFPFGAGAATALFNVAKVLKTSRLSRLSQRCAPPRFFVKFLWRRANFSLRQAARRRTKQRPKHTEQVVPTRSRARTRLLIRPQCTQLKVEQLLPRLDP